MSFVTECFFKTEKIYYFERRRELRESKSEKIENATQC